jgi:hypothetical protein
VLHRHRTHYLLYHQLQDWRIEQAMKRGDWYRTKDILNQGATDATHPSIVYPSILLYIHSSI